MSDTSHSKSKLLTLTVAAIGVVYGDIGTSPLYSLKECFSPHYGLTPGPNEVLGILSLIFWALTLIICVKYLLVIMRFDNNGEGGILALMELVSQRSGAYARMSFIFAMGIFGAALLYGDGIITPAISVLSAVEGLNVATTAFDPYILPITVAILLGLFMIQKQGTARVGKIFGPFMVFWFTLLGFLGVVSAVQTPEVLSAVNPWYALNFFISHDWHAFLVLGSVFLVVTGGEALYADMGHFGRKPITNGWFYLVYPGLILHYFGQGALLLREGHIASTVANPFYHMVPSWAVIPMVICAAFATVIASQAVISGAFSLTWQALQLGYLPRLKVQHTSHSERGQIYMPTVNWVLFISCVFLVLQFRSSGNLAAAYGIAVTTTMVITSILAWYAMRRIFKWSFMTSAALTSVFMLIDGSFFIANVFKIKDGGWVPVVMASATYFGMITWHRGRDLLRSVVKKRNYTLAEVLEKEIDRYEVVPGTALYMSSYKETAPPALVNNLKYNRARHETIIILTVSVKTQSHIERSERFEVKDLGKNVYHVILHYGFMDQPDLMDDLMYLPEYDIPVDITDATFVLGHEEVTVGHHEGMAAWRKHLFIFMHRNSRTPVKYFRVPFKRVLEIGSSVEI